MAQNKHHPSNKPARAKTPGIHPRNPHSGRYDLNALSKSYPSLTPFLKHNPRGELTIDFSSDQAVKALNAALLKQHYHIEFWDIPPGYLCPPIPGRADYIHHLADLLASANNGVIPNGKQIHGLDIGTGANLIYPLLATKSYGWKMTGSDIEAASLESAKAIITANRLEKSIRLTQQINKTYIFKGILKEQDHYHFTMCNPPFHASAKDAAAGTQRKLNNLRKSSTINPPKESKTQLNFGGQHNELWCDGGELQFIKRMIAESTNHKDQCLWFTTLVSKKENLPSIQRTLKKHKVSYFKEVKMAQGSKVSRFIAWTFQSQSDYPAWFS